MLDRREVSHNYQVFSVDDLTETPFHWDSPMAVHPADYYKMPSGIIVIDRPIILHTDALKERSQMPKIFKKTIYACGHCPNNTPAIDPLTNKEIVYCLLTIRRIHNSKHIQEWCPLPDAREESQ